MSRLWILAAFAIALVAGTVADRPQDREPLVIGDYRVLSADLHIHSAAGSGGIMTPWGLVGEARRQDLDVIAVTDHNLAWGGRVARAFSRLVPGPIVLAGEEVTSQSQDLIAVGIESTISPSLPLREQIAEVHRQGGVAIAAHPVAVFHHAYRDSGAADLIDGTEVCHPVMYERAGAGEELIDFAERTPAAPIGSTDFHASGRLGVCRTFIFARDATERDVLQALRERHTVVYASNGRAFGDPELIRLADRLGLRETAARYTRARGDLLDWISRLAAGAGLAGLVLVTWFPPSRRGAADRESGRHAPAR
jgi:hypothetical protein